MKNILRSLVPPIIWEMLSRIKKSFTYSAQDDEDVIFEGDDAMFKKYITSVGNYGEYGVGKSTLWVSKNTNATIHSVDSSKEWIENVKSKIKANDKIHLAHIDVGKLSDWGRPIDFSKRENFIKYIQSVWRESDSKNELVLIDGRFRIACFLYSLITAKPGTKIIFDDYKQRPQYHLVEEFIKPVEICGRQALFIVPASVATETIRQELEKFVYVID